MHRARTDLVCLKREPLRYGFKSADFNFYHRFNISRCLNTVPGISITPFGTPYKSLTRWLNRCLSQSASPAQDSPTVITPNTLDDLPRMATNMFTMPKRKLTWLITGCNSGFGLSLVRIAQAAGHTVIATSRNPSKTQDLVKEVESKGGRWLKLDVDDRASSQVIEDLEKSGTEIDVLVNNAGYSIFAPVEASTEDEIRAQMESMYFGPLRLIKALLPFIRRRHFGIIVNMSSGAALEGRDTMGPYAGAKAGLDGRQ